MVGEAGPGEVGGPFQVRGKIVAVGPDAELQVKGPASVTTLAADGAINGQEWPPGAFTPADAGVIAWAFDPFYNNAQFATTAGTVYLVGLLLRRKRLISNILFMLTSGATTPTASQNKVGLYNSALSLVEQVDVTSIIGTNGVKTQAITPVELPAGPIFVGMVFNASGQPALARMGSTTTSDFANLGRTTANPRAASGGTSQTSLPANPTASLSSQTLWAAVS